MRAAPGGIVRLSFAVGLLLITLAGCAAPSTATVGRSQAGSSITVFAAASLRTALESAAEAYRAVSPGAAVTLVTDSSTTLRTQIEQGAHADVFLAADTRNPTALADAGLTDGEPRPFATNAVILAVPHDNPAGIESAFDVARPGVRIVAAGEGVPISRYADALVEALAGQEDAPPQFAASWHANVVSREDNVSAVVAKLALGEGDAAIVYATDALATDGIAAVPLPALVTVEAEYAGAVLSAANDPAEARAFLAWLIDDGGQTVLRQFGFGPPSS